MKIGFEFPKDYKISVAKTLLENDLLKNNDKKSFNKINSEINLFVSRLNDISKISNNKYYFMKLLYHDTINKIKKELIIDKKYIDLFCNVITAIYRLYIRKYKIIN